MAKLNKSMTLQVLGLCAAILGCAHTGPEQPALSKTLELEAHFSSTTVRAGSVVHGQFVLRNVSSGPVSFCQTDGGVSVWVQLKDGETPRPLVLHGMVSDTPCNER